MLYPSTFSLEPKPWRSDLTEQRAFREALPRIQDFLIELFPYGNDNFGVLSEFVSDKRFFEITNGAEKNPVRSPDLPAERASTPSLRRQQKEDADDLKKQAFSFRLATNYARQKILQFFPDSLLSPLKVNGSLATVTSETIIETLAEQLEHFNAEDIVSIRAEISSPYVPGQSIRAVLNQQVLQNLRILTENGQALSNYDACRAIKAKFNPIQFEDCWKDYARTNGKVSKQTPQSLCEAIIVHVTERMHTHEQLHDVALVATKEAPSKLERLLETMQEAILRLEMAQSATALSAQAAPVQNLKKHPYCWTHGVCGHSSADCRSKAPGHQNTATERNKIGGSTRIRVKA